MAKSSSFTSAFPEATFRQAILNTMLMGMPQDPAQQLKWWWKRIQEFSPDDAAGNPYDWTQPPVTDLPGNPGLSVKNTAPGAEQWLTVPYALEFSARQTGSSNTAFGEIDTSRAVVSLTDTDYEKIKTADYATIGDTTYRIQFKGPAIGLFGYTLYQMYLEAEDSA
jgi:hypothetical protein